MSLIKSFKYRPEVDGLRAVAVLAVVFFHTGLGVPGGYIGVDVFFVISGYLITSLIVKDLQLGRFSMLDFWERRARRILPAAVVLVLVTVVAGWFLLLPSDLANLAKSAASQTIFAANFYFWRNTNYFAGPADEQALLHTWSLAVEEQYYMFVPLLLVLLFKLVTTRRRAVFLSVIGGGLVLSFIFSILSLPRFPAATFYLLPTRSWELLCGSLIALVPAAAIPKSPAFRELMSGIGLTGILLPCFLYTKETPFPGLAAVPPCLGAALFILGSTPQSETRLPRIAQLIALRPIVFIGLISYSLYLWHWPLVAFSHYWALADFSLTYRLGLLLASFVLGIMSWHFVETPFRTRKLGASRSKMFAYAGAGMVAIAGVGVCLILKNGFPERFSDRINAFDQVKVEAQHSSRIADPLTLEDALNGDFVRLGAAESDGVQCLVWGDSHARSILPAIIAAAEVAGAAVIPAWHSSTPPVLNYIPSSRFSLGEDSPLYAEAIINYVEKSGVPSVILVARWSGYFRDEAELLAAAAPLRVHFNDALIKTVHRLRVANVAVWILREVPNHLVSVPKALAKHALFDTDLSQWKCSAESYQQQNAPFDALSAALRLAGAQIIDVSGLLEDDDGYAMQTDGIPLYYDSDHLSKGSSDLLAPAFEAIFE